MSRLSLCVLSLLSIASSAGAIPEPLSLTLTSPTGGESWAAGSQHAITWKSTGLGNHAVRAEASTDGGKTWAPAGTADAIAGFVLWKVPEKLTDKCLVRLTAARVETAQSKPLSITASQEVKDYRWTQVAKKAEFAPRDGAGALVFKDKMWLIGGWNPGDKKNFPRVCNNEVWSSTDGAKWTLEKKNTFLDRTFDSTRDWEGRHTAGYVVFKDRMWIVGGDVNQGHYHDDVWNSSDGKQWTLVNKGKPVPWRPRALHHTLVFEKKIWVMGGQTIPQIAKEKEAFHRDVWTTSDGVKWEQVKPKEPYWSARGMIGGSAVFKGRIWILGGGTYDTPKVKTRSFYNDVWSSEDGVTWTRHAEKAPWEPRQYHEVAVFDGRLWVLEGYNTKGNRNDVWYSADGVNWYEVPRTPWKARHAASVFVHDKALWVVAGNNMESDAWKLQRSR
jgi:hypothetical protein